MAMTVIDYSSYIDSFNSEKPSSAADYITLMSAYCRKQSEWRSMLLYTIWHGTKKGYISLGGARDFVRMNMGAIIGEHSTNEHYIIQLAGIVDIILCDMLAHYTADEPYTHSVTNEIINPEEIIFNPRSLSHAYTFKGFYSEIVKGYNNGEIGYRDAYEIRKTLLEMFLGKTRDEISAYVNGVRQEIISNGGDDELPVVVLDTQIPVEDADSTVVTIRFNKDALQKARTFFLKKYGVDLLKPIS